MKYRIWASHCGDRAEIDSTVELKNDKEAISLVNKKQSLKVYGMDDLTLERIDVEEKTTWIKIK